MRTYGVDLVAYELRVRDALADLPADEIEELIEDLREHLAEINAEFPDGVDEQALVDRLGLPEVYAGELRAAAGFEPSYATQRKPSLKARMRARFEAQRDRVVSPQLREAMPFAQVAWWVARGWLLGYALSVLVFTDQATMSPLPDLRTAAGWMGLAVLLGSIATSIGFGVAMRKRRGHWRWLLMVVVNGVALVGLVAVAVEDRPRNVMVDGQAYASEPTMSNLVGPNGTPISNIYAFDRAGKPLKEVYLFDQDGQPIDLIREACEPTDRFGGFLTDNQFPRPRLRWDDNGACREDAAIPFTAVIKPAAPSMVLQRPEEEPVGSR